MLGSLATKRHSFVELEKSHRSKSGINQSDLVNCLDNESTLFKISFSFQDSKNTQFAVKHNAFIYFFFVAKTVFNWQINSFFPFF